MVDDGLGSLKLTPELLVGFSQRPFNSVGGQHTLHGILFHSLPATALSPSS